MKTYELTIAIALVAGLRTFVPIAAVRYNFMNWTTWLAGLLAIGELVADKLPGVPGRTQVGPLIARSISGAYCAWAIGTPLGLNAVTAACIGVAGAIAGAYIGFGWRVKVAPAMHWPPVVAALLEDAVAIVVAFWVVLGAH